jgi:hypothetical protein
MRNREEVTAFSHRFASATPDCPLYQSACSPTSAIAASLRTSRGFFTVAACAHLARQLALSYGSRLREALSSGPWLLLPVLVPGCPGGALCPGESTPEPIRWEYPNRRMLDVVLENLGERDVQSGHGHTIIIMTIYESIPTGGSAQSKSPK